MSAPVLAATAVGGALVAYFLMKASNSKRVPHGIVVYYHSACKGFTGRADAIIRMLEHAGCRYTCKEVGDVPASFTADKGCFAVPFVQLPDGLVLSQSQAIHMHLGRTLGLFPTTLAGEAQALQVALNAADIISEGLKKLKGDEKRLAKWLSVFEGSLATTGTGFFVGSQLSYADFASYSWLKLTFGMVPDASAYPRIAAFVKMMDALPSTQAFNAKGVPLLPASMMP